MLANSKLYCCQHISVLEICCPLGMLYFISCSVCIYIYLSFSSEVRSLPPAVAQSATLSLGRGDFQFLCLENKNRVSKGLFCWEGWVTCGDLGCMDDIPLAGLVSTLCDPACFALCCLSPWLDEEQEHQQ